MRRALIALSALLTATALAAPANAQLGGNMGRQGPQTQQSTRQNGAEEAQERRQRAPRIAPLSRRANAGPCPYVKILYDAARYVELQDNQARLANVGYTGEIEGLSADCEYREGDPIQLDMQVLFSLGRGQAAAGQQHTYRYWIAVTERNRAILAKTYFDIPVTFDASGVAEVREERSITIPRASEEVSGGNFEVLVGFDVTPEMAEFNRSGSRFRIQAGEPAAAPAQQ
ncbi:MAG: Tat pathway signal sequence domain protein [Brevundimonas sp.]|nr:MAG: Tat pathway signal sequence domain protein [Brevundimonas sp.]